MATKKNIGKTGSRARVAIGRASVNPKKGSLKDLDTKTNKVLGGNCCSGSHYNSATLQIRK
jgi:hypothetical protein